MSIYKYSYEDFHQGINTDKLTHELTVKYPLNFQYLTATSEVNIVFATPLTAEEKTELDGIVATFTPDWDIPGSQIMQFAVTTQECTSTSFVELGCTVFPLGNIYPTNIKFIGKVSEGSPQPYYQIRVRDMTTNGILASGEFTNTDTQIVDLGAISNVPMDQTIVVIEALVEDAAYPLTLLDAKLYYD
jgi:hypothetical protein